MGARNLSILHLLKEVGVLFNARGVESVVVGANRNHQLVICHLELRPLASAEVVAHAAGHLDPLFGRVEVAGAVDEGQLLLVLVERGALGLNESH
eukprot:3934139-Rhodomonas_salina.1